MIIDMFISGGSEVIAFSSQMWGMIAAIVLVFISLQIVVVLKSFSFVKNYRYSHRYCLAFIAICTLLSHSIHIWADGTFNKDITKQTYVLPLAYLATAKSLMAEYGFLDVEAHKKRALLKQKSQAQQVNRC